MLPPQLVTGVPFRIGKSLRHLLFAREYLGGFSKDRLLPKMSYTSRIPRAAGAGLAIFEFAPRLRAARNTGTCFEQ
jgi:hypothetical protein